MTKEGYCSNTNVSSSFHSWILFPQSQHSAMIPGWFKIQMLYEIMFLYTWVTTVIHSAVFSTFLHSNMPEYSAIFHCITNILFPYSSEWCVCMHQWHKNNIFFTIHPFYLHTFSYIALLFILKQINILKDNIKW